MLGFAGLAQAAIGIYTGSFDPFTKGHEALVRKALQDPRIERLYIIVNKSGAKNFNLSSFERAELINAAMSDLKDKVEVKGTTQEGKEAYIQKLADGRKIVSVIGEDSFNVLPKQVLTDPSREWLVFKRNETQPMAQTGFNNVRIYQETGAAEETSSSLVRSMIDKPEVEKYLSAKVLTLIRQQGFYQAEKNPEVAELQKAFYESSFKNFKENLQKTHPETEFSSLTAPPYKTTQTRKAWGESFLAEALRVSKKKNKEAMEFWDDISKLMFSFPRKQPKPRVSFAEALVQPKFKATKVLSTKNELLKTYNQKQYTLDVNDYAGDRFPTELGAFVRTHQAELYLHNSDEDHTLEYHRAQGFDQFYHVITPRSHPDAVNILAYSTSTHKYRFVLSGLGGQDRRAQAKSHLAAAGFIVPVYEVEHQEAKPLFSLTPEGQKLRLGPQDLVVMGFKNRVDKMLPDFESWQATSISEVGVDITAYSKNGHRVVFVKNVYGDEMKTLLNYFKSIGAKKMVYLGTAGGLGAQLSVGEVLLPTRIHTEEKDFAFPNATELLGNLEATGVQVKRNVTHGWVQTLLSETNRFLKAERANGSESLDIETKYLAEFLAANPSIRGAVALLVSDLPLGTVTYDQHDTTIYKVEESLQKIIPTIYSEVLPSNHSVPAIRSCSQMFSAAG